MKVKIFTLLFDSDAGGFDDEPLQEFLEGKEVLTLFEHFFVYDHTPAWTLLITYREAEQSDRREWRGRRGTDYRKELSNDDRQLYDAISKWRRERALREGVPSYIVLSNRQIADLARLRPSTLKGLVEVKGLGRVKSKQFGEELIALIGAVPQGAKPEAEAQEAEGGS